MRRWMLLMLVVAFACTASRDQATSVMPPADAAAVEPAELPEPPSEGPEPPVLTHLVTDDDDDEAAALRRVGAVPAWQAVVERGSLLARRGQGGVVFGRIGDAVATPPDAYRWLVDETEGEGALAIRLALAPGVTVEEGERVAAWGAWHLDDERRWYWRAERLALLPAGSPATNADRLVAPMVAQAPPQAIPASQLESDGDILFEIRTRPRDPTGGWEISDPGNAKAVARLLLPGERPSYGGQDYRAPDEYWQLDRNTVYTVTARRHRRLPADKLPILQARGIPRRVSPTND